MSSRAVRVAGAARAARAARVARGTKVSAADAFFLYVESAQAPQHVGGLVVLDRSQHQGGAPTRDDVIRVVQAQLDRLPRFTQQLAPMSRWRRPRWRTVDSLDWSWHVPLVDLTDSDGRPGGLSALDDLVAQIQATPLPRDRPLWRLFVVHGVDAQHAAVVFVVHHVVADGFGTVAQALHLLEPALPSRELPDGMPGRARTALAIAVGLAQLATDGRPHGRLPTGNTAQRRFGSLALPLDEIRVAARRRGVRLSDLLLCAVSGGLTRVLPPGAASSVRTSVPLMVRAPGAAIEGNVTAAVMLDLPLGALDEQRRLDVIASRTQRLRRPSRAIAGRFVMDAVGEVLPPPLHRRFARSVYGPRVFQAIVSNMPGPDVELSLAGRRIKSAFPILPLAPGAPLAVGALGWNGQLCLGVSADPALIPDAGAYLDSVRDVMAELCQESASVSASR